jgi:hypothetical protein
MSTPYYLRNHWYVAAHAFELTGAKADRAHDLRSGGGEVGPTLLASRNVRAENPSLRSRKNNRRSLIRARATEWCSVLPSAQPAVAVDCP